MPTASLNTNVLLYAVLLLALSLPPKLVRAETVRLAVAANFTGVTNQLVPLYEKTSGNTLKVSFGSTGKLYAQIVHGAPFDLFLAADQARPKRLVKEGVAIESSRFTYARGRLMLWSSDVDRFKDGESYLRSGNFRKLATANPKTAPYGLAAQQLLQHLGIAQTLSAKLVLGDSIAQTFQFTATGNAQLGLVAASQVKRWSQRGSQWLIPDSYYQPIAQQAVLLKKGESNLAASHFLQFLKSPTAQSIIRDYGYAVE